MKSESLLKGRLAFSFVKQSFGAASRAITVEEFMAALDTATIQMKIFRDIVEEETKKEGQNGERQPESV